MFCRQYSVSGCGVALSRNDPLVFIMSATSAPCALSEEIKGEKIALLYGPSAGRLAERGGAGAKSCDLCAARRRCRAAGRLSADLLGCGARAPADGGSARQGDDLLRDRLEGRRLGRTRR